MANFYRLNDRFEVDLDKILCTAAVDIGIRLTYVDWKEEVIAPLTTSERERFFDVWLGCSQADKREIAAGMKEAG